MIEIFYYVGIFCLASCIEEVVNIKRLKKSNDFANETINETNNKIDEIKGKIDTAEMIDVSKEISSAGDIYKKSLKKTNPLRLIVGLITMIWNIVGVFISEQRISFIVLLLITFFSPYLIRSITKDEKQQIILNYITSVVSLIFVGIMLYRHFFLGYN